MNGQLPGGMTLPSSSGHIPHALPDPPPLSWRLSDAVTVQPPVGHVNLSGESTAVNVPTGIVTSASPRTKLVLTSLRLNTKVGGRETALFPLVLGNFFAPSAANAPVQMANRSKPSPSLFFMRSNPLIAICCRAPNRPAAADYTAQQQGGQGARSRS